MNRYIAFYLMHDGYVQRREIECQDWVAAVQIALDCSVSGVMFRLEVSGI